MRKKFFLSLMILVLTTGVFSTSALAMQGDVGPDGAPARYRPRAVRGEITAIAADGGAFDLLIKNGETLTFLVNEETQYRGQVSAFEDLTIGAQTAVGFVPRPDVGLIAKQVLVHDQLDRVGRIGGKVAGVDLDANTFVLAVPKRGEITFQADEKTRYKGAVTGLEDLNVNQVAQVAFVRAEEQPLKALIVVVPERQPVQRFLGQLQSIDLDANQFSIENRQGETVNLVVDENTQYRSPNGEINGLGDLEVGMPVAAGGIPESDGTYLAKWIGATDQPLPKVPIRVGGEILETGSGKFSLETPRGKTLNFVVTDETIFRGRGGDIDALEDLAPGMKVGVGAEDIGDGVLQANVVLVGR